MMSIAKKKKKNRTEQNRTEQNRMHQFFIKKTFLTPSSFVAMFLIYVLFRRFKFCLWVPIYFTISLVEIWRKPK